MGAYRMLKQEFIDWCENNGWIRDLTIENENIHFVKIIEKTIPVTIFDAFFTANDYIFYGKRNPDFDIKKISDNEYFPHTCQQGPAKFFIIIDNEIYFNYIINRIN